MKKIITLTLILIFALLLVGCNTDGQNINSDGTFSKNDESGIGSTVESTVSGVVSGAGEVVSDVVSGANSMVSGAASGATQNQEAKITANEAKKIALDHAGLKESDVTGIKVDLDRDNNVLKYEIDFTHGGTEYDYDIDANTGKIISVDKEQD